MDNSGTFGWVTTLAAFVGMALGVLNTAHAFLRCRPRLRVSHREYRAPGGQGGVLIRVVNVGAVPVYVDQVAFGLSKPRGHFFFFTPAEPGVCRFPYLLDAGAQCDVFIRPDAYDNPSFADITRPFARTATGRYFHGRRVREPAKLAAAWQRRD